MNALALQDAFERHGIPTRVMSAIEMRLVSEPLQFAVAPYIISKRAML